MSAGDGLDRLAKAVAASDPLIAAARAKVLALCASDGQLDPEALNARQHLVHGFAWMEAYRAAMQACIDWLTGLDAAGRQSRIAQVIGLAGLGEYLAQLGHGIAMSQDEFIRPGDFGLDREAAEFLRHPAVAAVIESGRAGARLELVSLLQQAGVETLAGLSDSDETLALVRQQFRAFADREIAPHAQGWHRRDELIPLPLVQRLAALGVFGLTAPEEYGGSAMGVGAMCAVTEELSRGYIGAGSLGTRSEIAVELIRAGGTDEQKQRWLKAIISGEILPTAVFTEPQAGSDLASLTTRAERDGGSYRLSGAKTWITHASRADLMLVLARTGAPGSGHRGLSMFLVKKPRGSAIDPFPMPGLSGSEIPVLGYRGMKEYEIAFDGMRVGPEALLGGVEGQGFRQLMATFELARIQTAARALGVAQNAFELAFQYAHERKQFGRSIASFPRVHNKLAWIAIETMMVRQLVHSVARRKQAGGRCDVEAGMAKLLAARVAWSCADNALQVHGGNGYALEYPVSRLLCDARILNIFEGAAEIQAQVIARGLLGRAQE